MATYKSVGHKSLSFGFVLEYDAQKKKKEGKEQKQEESVLPIYVHNMNVSGVDLKEIEEAFLHNASYLKERKNGNVFYHESMHFHPKDSAYLKAHPEALEDIARVYMESRAPHALGSATVHTDKEHLHIHFIVSANEKESGKRIRMSTTEFKNMKLHMDNYQKEFHPEIKHSYRRTGKERDITTTKSPKLSKQEKHIKDTLELEKLDKEQLREVLLESAKGSQDLQQLQTSLTEQGLEVYTYRGKANGVIYEGKKYRFSTLLGRKHEETKRIQELDKEYREQQLKEAEKEKVQELAVEQRAAQGAPQVEPIPQVEQPIEENRNHIENEQPIQPQEQVPQQSTDESQIPQQLIEKDTLQQQVSAQPVREQEGEQGEDHQVSQEQVHQVNLAQQEEDQLVDDIISTRPGEEENQVEEKIQDPQEASSTHQEETVSEDEVIPEPKIEKVPIPRAEPDLEETIEVESKVPVQEGEELALSSENEESYEESQEHLAAESDQDPDSDQEELQTRRVIVEEGEIVGVEEVDENLLSQDPQVVEKAEKKAAVKDVQRKTWRSVYSRDHYNTKDQQWIMSPKSDRSLKRSERDFVLNTAAKYMKSSKEKGDFLESINRLGITLVPGQETYGVPMMQYRGRLYSCNLRDRFTDRGGDMKYKWNFWKQPIEEQRAYLEEVKQQRREMYLSRESNVYKELLDIVADANSAEEFEQLMNEKQIEVLRSDDGNEVIGVKAVGKEYLLSSFFNEKDSSFHQFYRDKIAGWSMDPYERERFILDQEQAFRIDLLNSEWHLESLVKGGLREANNLDELKEILGKEQVDLVVQEDIDGKHITGIDVFGKHYEISKFIGKENSSRRDENSWERVMLLSVSEEEKREYLEAKEEESRSRLLVNRSYVWSNLRDAISESETPEEAEKLLVEKGMYFVKDGETITGIKTDYSSFTMNSLFDKDEKFIHERLYQWSLPVNERQERQDHVEKAFQEELLYNRFYLGRTVINTIANSKTQDEWGQLLKEKEIELVRNEKTNEVEGIMAGGKSHTLESFIRPERYYLLDKVKDWDTEATRQEWYGQINKIDFEDEGNVRLMSHEKTGEVTGISIEGKEHQLENLDQHVQSYLLAHVEDYWKNYEKEQSRLRELDEQTLAVSEEEVERIVESQKARREEELQIERDKKNLELLEMMEVHERLDTGKPFYRWIREEGKDMEVPQEEEIIAAAEGLEEEQLEEKGSKFAGPEIEVEDPELTDVANDMQVEEDQGHPMELTPEEEEMTQFQEERKANQEEQLEIYAETLEEEANEVKQENELELEVSEPEQEAEQVEVEHMDPPESEHKESEVDVNDKDVEQQSTHEEVALEPDTGTEHVEVKETEVVYDGVTTDASTEPKYEKEVVESEQELDNDYDYDSGDKEYGLEI